MEAVKVSVPAEEQKGNPVLRGIAHFISVLFHPVFFPVIMSIVLYLLMPASFAGLPPALASRWLLVIALITVFFPLFSIALMRALKFISSLQLKDPKERIIPLIATMTFYFWCTHVFNHFPEGPVLLRSLLLGAFWGVIAIFMINIFFKISMHTTAAGGMLGLMTLILIYSPVNYFLYFAIAAVVAGLIGTARMILGAHRLPELWLGYLVGFAVQIGAWYYLK